MAQLGKSASIKDAILELRMSSSSIISALDGLEEKEVIEKENSHYKIINPIVKFYVLKPTRTMD